jgi:hypothetical protein
VQHPVKGGGVQRQGCAGDDFLLQGGQGSGQQFFWQ